MASSSLSFDKGTNLGAQGHLPSNFTFSSDLCHLKHVGRRDYFECMDLATRRPPGCPALSWFFGVILTLGHFVAARSAYWPLNVLLTVKC